MSDYRVRVTDMTDDYIEVYVPEGDDVIVIEAVEAAETDDMNVAVLEYTADQAERLRDVLDGAVYRARSVQS